MKKLPVYKLSIDESIDDLSGVTCISLVEMPAIEINFEAFNKHFDNKNPLLIKLKIENEEKRIVSGPILIPEIPIYRKVENEEYYITLDKDTIYKISQKFFKTNRINSVNADHSSNILNGCYMFESFIIDKHRGIQAPKNFEYLNDGTWFGSYKIDNNEVWNEIKAGNFKGFSIEGIFDYIETGKTVEQKLYKQKSNAKKSYKQIYDELQQILKDYFETEEI